ncbi:hypothetical protein BDN70DRAFT_614960 [Pholiota conissans]|uniref:Uncharacterized protein n=1 Tax=Pholiota conissans TaxID=109636 RepID=A0A9P5Z4F5_9AGAR|nr:hypothetical protein BDN70DRAFT_614960 [Pholiota conissans]
MTASDAAVLFASFSMLALLTPQSSCVPAELDLFFVHMLHRSGIVDSSWELKVSRAPERDKDWQRFRAGHSLSPHVKQNSLNKNAVSNLVLGTYDLSSFLHSC